MKKTALFFSFCALLAACDSETKKTETTETSVREASSAELNSDSVSSANLSAVAHQPTVDTNATKIGTEHTGGVVAKGAKLITASDCTSCHKERDLLVGPAYTAVAQKYPATDANITMLANKIIQGGKGNWGEVAMTPHPGVPVEDAKEMVKYILSLK
ncbi:MULTISPECIES: c-type cytochrome [Hymenobacter]|uniref:C-type cytochrome n=1 Tax=Hymenobacter jejuensis TaxID=2502781 RepID=A0A5B8A2P4_9BACT|nr:MULTISPECIES: c-type cytochrome [Hymenobacter]MBC6989559.1 c-type cytochrome [Hymenobacter sp. BT491]QDA61578.1 c-type cytochrome [Hymenobacter jejuensis]